MTRVRKLNNVIVIQLTSGSLPWPFLLTTVSLKVCSYNMATNLLCSRRNRQSTYSINGKGVGYNRRSMRRRLLTEAASQPAREC